MKSLAFMTPGQERWLQPLQADVVPLAFSNARVTIDTGKPP
jgi:hypothetical protein